MIDFVGRNLSSGSTKEGRPFRLRHPIGLGWAKTDGMAKAEGAHRSCYENY